MARLPIVVLAFANEQEGQRYLRNLPEELRQLREILKEAERKGLCRLEVLSNATLDEIFDVFTRNRGEVAILHYGGHADSGHLLLESGAAEGAHAIGLAKFLEDCAGLQLVFLNGCSTRAQIPLLLDAGVGAVIATARAIDDAMARAFAVAFYTELAFGAQLSTAYTKAQARLLAAHGNVSETYYVQRDVVKISHSASPDPADDQGFPWEFRKRIELVDRWSLPDAAGNPEFGLPPLPARDLPPSPFRDLKWFTAEHAEVFFGRGYDIREMYEQVVDKSGPPILLLYGASGVGKSSLLDAGLVPRLKSGGHEVRYARRDQQKGLSGSLRDVLQLRDRQTCLNERWRAEEARLGKPLVVFLDQVEEVFTRPDPAQPLELDEFFDTLKAALAIRDKRPQGKLVLGFRKEWLAEIDRRLIDASLDQNPVFLKPIDRRGIIEAIRGPARQERLQRKYHLAIDDGLPEVIADDLLSDVGSALAPALQVLLTKMWERARHAKPEQPRFDRALYESLKKEGLLLSDVLNGGLTAVRRWNAGVEESGLALDVLTYHTTDLGTASQCTSADLQVRYAHDPGTLDRLLGQFRDNYLLIEADPRPDDPAPSTRLAHDLLAPLVQQRFRLSVAPGQRARRLLENRLPDWKDGKTGPYLDRADLHTVLEGTPGMRAWEPDEVRLVEASRAQDERLRQQEEDEARRLHEAEEGRLKAEASARQEAERRLDEQRKANEQQIEANRQLEDANYKTKQTIKRLWRVVAGLAATITMLGVAIGLVIYERFEVGKQRDRAENNLWNFKKEERARIGAQTKDLLDADPQAVPEILKAVRASDDAMKALTKMRTSPELSVKQSGRAALALLDKNPAEADFLLRQVLSADSDPEELFLVRTYLVPYMAGKHNDPLWQVVNSKSSPDLRIRHAAVLAAFDNQDARWKQAGEKVVADILGANALQLGDWTNAFRGVKSSLVEYLVRKFRGGDEDERKVAATILNDYAADNVVLILDLLKDADAQQFPILLATATASREEAVKSMTDEVAFNLLKDADARQFPVLYAKARDEPAAAAKSMTEEVAKKPAPKSSDEQKDKLASRQANALITLAMLGQTDPLWPALRHGIDPRLRTYLIQRMGRLGFDFKILAARLFDETDPSIRTALVLSLGEFPYDLRVDEINRLLAERLLKEYARDPDAGFHSAVAWLLRNLGSLDGEAVDDSLAGKTPDPKQSWLVNKEGQTFVILKDPGVFVMGSPADEPWLGKRTKEQQHHRRIPRSFAISTREVTVAEFTKFLRDPAAKDVKYLAEDQTDYSPNERGPIPSVSWFEAAQYCRWLSALEGIPEDQQCYPPIPEIKENMELYPDHLMRTGYRLPTEAEWEYACRANSQTPWSFGSDISLLKEFAWLLTNSSTKNTQQQAQETGLKKPNAFGLFDMHGNVYEWCSDRDPPYPASDGPPVDDTGNERADRKVIDADIRIYRGGSFADLPLNLRSAYRDVARPTTRYPAVGFRLVRTYRPN